MKTYARIEGGTVAEILSTSEPIAALFHPSLRWEDITGKTVAVGETAQPDGTFAPAKPAVALDAPPPTLAELHAQLARLSAQIAALAPHA